MIGFLIKVRGLASQFEANRGYDNLRVEHGRCWASLARRGHIHCSHSEKKRGSEELVRRHCEVLDDWSEREERGRTSNRRR